MQPLGESLECACSGGVRLCGQGQHVSAFSLLDSLISSPGLTVPVPCLPGPGCLPLAPALTVPDPGYPPRGQHPRPLATPDLALAACPLRQRRVRRSLRGVAASSCLQILRSFKTYQEGSWRARRAQDGSCSHAAISAKRVGDAATLFRATKYHGCDDQSPESLRGMT